MKGTRAFHILFVLLVSSMIWATAHAQGGNLLTNPGFEPPFQTLSGDPPRVVAQGWTPWHITGAGGSFSELIQPEYYAASDDTNGLGIPRIRSGNDAQQYFTFFATHSGGVYQRVTGVTPGTNYRFEIYAYVWSTNLDDVNVSAEPGGVVMQVGIDPIGGTDPNSASIVWSAAGSPQYDSYVPYQVTTIAQGTAVTVFVRSTVSAPVKNNVIYLDDASLTVADGTPVAGVNTPTPTVVPPTTPPTATPTTAVPTVAQPTDAPPTDAPPTTEPPTAEQPTDVPPPTEVPPTEVVPTEVPPTEVPPTEVPPTATFTFTPQPTATGPTLTPSPSPTVDRGQFPGTIVHTVRSGDTVGRLAELYGSTIEAIISANGLNANGLIYVGQGLVIPVRLGAPATAVPTTVPNLPPAATQPPAAPTTTIYVVRPGDSLSGIAARFGTTTTTLAQLNNIVNRDLIYAGQRLIVPSGGGTISPLPTAIVLQPGNPASGEQQITRTYRVQTGDNLYNIALRFNVPLNRLIQANGILDANRLYLGQVLIIP